MKQFVDRQQEMETLQSEYERNGSALVVLYGRRRVGKTTLISEFIRDKNALFSLRVKSPKHKTERHSKRKQQNSLIAIFCVMRMSRAGT